MSNIIIRQNSHLQNIPSEIDDCLISLIKNANIQVTSSVKKGQTEQNAIITHYNNLMSKINQKVDLLGMSFYIRKSSTRLFFLKNYSIAELKQIAQKNNISVIDKRCKDAFAESIADWIEERFTIQKALQTLIDNVIQLSIMYHQKEIELDEIPLVYRRFLSAFLHRNQYIDLSDLDDKEIIKGQSYQEFLNSRYWDIIKSNILKRDNYRCSICQTTNSLHIHHKTNPPHEIGLCHLEDLITICSSCRKAIYKL